jgi:hypothetical protein
MIKSEVEKKNYTTVKQMPGVTILNYSNGNVKFEILILKNAILYGKNNLFYFIKTICPWVTAMIYHRILR